MPQGSVFRIRKLLEGSLVGTGKKEWPDGTSRLTRVTPIKFTPGTAIQKPASVVTVESTAGLSKETPSSSAQFDVVATLDSCIVLDAPSKPFFWLPPVSSR